MAISTPLQVYKELAGLYDRQGQAAMRDRFLILAAEAAFSAGIAEEAEILRKRLLQANPHHMLKPFESFAQALQSKNIQIYIHDLQVNYPPQTAEQLLQNMRGGASPQTANEKETMMGTAPRIDPRMEIPDEPTLPLGPTAEPLKFYPLHDDPKPAASALPSKPAAAKHPAPALSAKGGKGAAPAPSPPPARPRPQPSPPRQAARAIPPSPPSESIAPTGSWLPLVLLGMIVTAGVALVFYTLVRPFLPLP